MACFPFVSFSFLIVNLPQITEKFFFITPYRNDKN
uniref:Uncharacterized protein n=1 Tax=Coprothermobacter proteolyticus (strain ATCC 35245 / DSM 5265 / OCM 4 / BT) TaxID=309798 RepID=B5Y6M1_COPPD